MSVQPSYVPQKFKSFISEPEGCAIVTALEDQNQCRICILNDNLSIVPLGTMPVDVQKVEMILREMWQKREVQMMIRQAALNASCSHICQTILPRAYTSVVMLFSADIRRRSRCSDILANHSDGKVDIFGTEMTVAMARDVMIEILTDHFGPLELEIPFPRRTQRSNYGIGNNSYNALEVLTPQDSYDNMFQPEPNAILSPTPPSVAQFDDLDNQVMFLSENPYSGIFRSNSNLTANSVATPPPEINNNSISPSATSLEKLLVWISNEDVGRILGNRAIVKKQIEILHNVLITVRTDCLPHFGMIAVEVVGQNADTCKQARDAIFASINSPPTSASPIVSTPENPLKSTDSGFSSPVSQNDLTSSSSSVSPDKRFSRRSSFRDQPKVVLALTPRKSPPTD
ncbi:unnamed protein product [Caenorhabditis angaria]|uniref:K Homology domain-containing protein n=1 Tax=Caenorhabditis angaria TaxID=860376 RepID=A0A9P1I5N5_9PELO|nr:unnamed protein product [Caenorhabditis angaria]